MHDTFLTALRANPNDDVTRLVYADWLQDRDDPRAEFLRLEVHLAAGVPPGERGPLTTQLAALARRADPGWLLKVNRVPFVWCDLRRRSGNVSPLEGQVEFANYSTGTLLIVYDTIPAEHLRARISGPSNQVWECAYWPLMSGELARLRLAPGERYSANVNLLGITEPRELAVGTYAIQAVFDYEEVRSYSDPVRVELTDEDCRRWELGPYASG